MSLRDLTRSFAIWPWEIEQAAELGWLHITLRRRADRGRPVRLVELSDERDAELPKPRRQIEPEISGRHRIFAMRAVHECCPGGGRTFGMTIPPVVEAYLVPTQVAGVALQREQAPHD